MNAQQGIRMSAKSIFSFLSPLLMATLLQGTAAAAPRAATKDSTAFPQATSDLPILDSDPQVGRRDAPLTIVVMVDYQEPYSRFYLRNGIPALRQRYGAKLRVVYKDAPQAFHKNAVDIAAAVHGVYALAGANGFEKFVELVGEHQGELDPATLTGLAVVAGVKDRGKYEQGLLVQGWLREVQASKRVADDLQVMGTPTTFVNGLSFVGAVTGKALEDKYPAIDAELAASEAELKRGFKPIDLYGYRVKQNLDRKLGEPAPLDDPSVPELRPEEAVGVVRLGMTMAELTQLAGVRVKPWTSDRACATVSKRSDECMYTLYFKNGVIDKIYYYISARGLRFDGKTLETSAPLAQALRVLHCGQFEVGEGGGEAQCPHHVALSRGSIRCHKLITDEAETGCHTDRGGPTSPGNLEVRISR
jgi:protein-disulfide isomerase